MPALGTLILGGARSGKSTLARTMAEASGLAPVLIATAEARDEEMSGRIRLHRLERSSLWRCVEEPLDVCGCIQSEGRAGGVIVVDCLTLWLSNLLERGLDPAPQTAALVDILGCLAAPVILVSNEVGMGIVPDNALARRFRDDQGRLNSAVAAICDQVVLVVAGQPLVIKPSLLAPVGPGAA